MIPHTLEADVAIQHMAMPQLVKSLEDVEAALRRSLKNNPTLERQRRVLLKEIERKRMDRDREIQQDIDTVGRVMRHAPSRITESEKKAFRRVVAFAAEHGISATAKEAS